MANLISQALSIGGRYLNWRATRRGIPTRPSRVLVFFHGYSLAHTIRPMVVARALRELGVEVVCAGVGPHAHRFVADGFSVRPVTTMPQERIDRHVASGQYTYYDEEWVERCVDADRQLISELTPHLVVADFRPSLRISAALHGVDLAEIDAAYNQPGYPFPIRVPETLRPDTTSFDSCLIRRSSQIQPHTTLRLVADVPEFHPPGEVYKDAYRYVGPLIDDEPEPANISILDDTGWDTSLPLVHLTCGSTGATPAFMNSVLSALCDLPCRALVTTAGRWDGPSPSQNIRLVDFLPANWVLRKAHLHIGTGGIGTVYHALKAGVPVIGAPEHLDQEYHLNRVRDLGLGIKIDWQELHDAGALTKAIRHVLGEYRELRKRCESFSPYVQAWRGGESAAAAIVTMLNHRDGASGIPRDSLVSEPEFLHHLTLSTPPELCRRDLRRMLQQGVRRGMPQQRLRGRRYYDSIESWNWLYDRVPGFFEADYRSLELRRKAYLSGGAGGVTTACLSQRYLVTCTYRVYPQTLSSSAPLQLIVPYPLRSQYQPCVELVECTPPQLREYLVPAAGFFYGYSLTPDRTLEEPIEVSYTCRVQVQARVLERRLVPPLGRAEQERYTQVNSRLAWSDEVQRLVNTLDLKADQPAAVQARLIYLHLASTKRFRRTRDACRCLSCCTHAVLAGNGGHCITLSRAFIALCRLRGIPAREVCGALVGYPTAPGRYEIGVFNEVLFGHTWAECFLADFGWIPVEFHSTVIASQAMTNHNVTDDVLRSTIERQSQGYQDYYFGNLDCHRVICSNSVKEIPQAITLMIDENGGVRWHRPPGLRDESRLTCECLPS